ncbi:5-carboxymethyl-2-hydroxymuconate Delta-isomerase [Colwellia sp. MEBiC06753]
MPHITIEYSSDITQQISPQTMLESVKAGAIASDLFDVDTIKLRAIAFDHAIVGNSDKCFIHITTRILSGRTLEQRQMLSDKIIAMFQNMSLQELSITVEVVEMERESYGKYVC